MLEEFRLLLRQRISSGFIHNSFQSTALAKKKQSSSTPDPEYLKKRKASLRRIHRQVIYLNDKELDAVNEYCARFGIKERSSIFREAAMERILDQLDDSHPTLF
jgi:hypothetical protein